MHCLPPIAHLVLPDPPDLRVQPAWLGPKVTPEQLEQPDRQGRRVQLAWPVQKATPEQPERQGPQGLPATREIPVTRGQLDQPGHKAFPGQWVLQGQWGRSDRLDLRGHRAPQEILPAQPRAVIFQAHTPILL